MSLELNLFLKNTHDKIHYKLEEILNIYNEINIFFNLENEINDEEIQIVNYLNKLFYSIQKEVNFIKQIYSKKVENICCHEMIYDLIDINPDTSKIIKYCNKCYYTET
jgi:hypothetical protein